MSAALARRARPRSRSTCSTPRERPSPQRLLADDPLFRAEVERLRATDRSARRARRWPSWQPGRRRRARRRPRGDAAPAGPRRRARAARPSRRRRGAVLVPAGAAGGAAPRSLVVRLRRPAEDDGAPPTTLTLQAAGRRAGRGAADAHAATAPSCAATGMPPSGAHDYYEAWLADARGRMVSMGTFRVGRDGSVDAHMAVAVDVRRYRLVDVSLEPDDGNPGALRARSVMRATISSSSAARG